MDELRPLDWQALRAQVKAARPFPFFCVDGFLHEDVAREAAEAFPPFDEAVRLGRTFTALNERKKVQITDSARFPPPVARVHRLLSDPAFLARLAEVFELPPLLPDEQLIGGGMHETGPHGRLDVHVDFNYLEERKLHRRLNILLYLNPGWQPGWGGEIELWDEEVRRCEQSFLPVHNRCLVFQTSANSFHGTRGVFCPPSVVRRSFAAYYYSREAPPGWNGKTTSTIFRARPDERLLGGVLMPLAGARRALTGTIVAGLRAAKHRLLGRPR